MIRHLNTNPIPTIMETTRRLMSANKLLTVTVASVTSLFLALSLLSTKKNTKRDLNCDEENEDHANQHFAPTESSSKTPSTDSRSGISASGSSDVLNRDNATFWSFNQMVTILNSSVRTINKDFMDETQDNTIMIAANPFAANSSIFDSSGDVQYSPHIITEPHSSPNPSVSLPLFGAPNEPANIEDDEHIEIPMGGIEGNHEQQQDVQHHTTNTALFENYPLKRTNCTCWVRFDEMRDEDFDVLQ